MPLQQHGIVRPVSDIEEQVKQQLYRLFASLDRKMAEMSRARGLRPSNVKLLEPVQECVFVGDKTVFVALSSHIPGGIALEQFLDWTGKSMNMVTALSLVERDLGFRDAFGFEFPRSVLDLDDNDRASAVAQIAEEYIEDEIANLERQERIVRLNPIFVID